MSHRAVLRGRRFERGRLRLLVLVAMLDLPLLFRVLMGPAHHPTPPVAADALLKSLLFLHPSASHGKSNKRGKVFAALQILLQLSPERRVAERNNPAAEILPGNKFVRIYFCRDRYGERRSRTKQAGGS